MAFYDVDNAMTVKLDYELPKVPAFREGIRRAPRREAHLSGGGQGPGHPQRPAVYPPGPPSADGPGVCPGAGGARPDLRLSLPAGGGEPHGKAH